MALGRALTAEGHQLVRVTRGTIGSNEATIGWDPGGGTIDAGGFEGVDAVVHLAGAGIADRRWSDHRKRVVKQSREKGTRLLATTLADMLATIGGGPEVLVTGSAIGYYGDRGDEILNEQSGPGDLFLSEVCQAWESAAQPAIDAGIRTAVIRTGIVLDDRGGVRFGNSTPSCRRDLNCSESSPSP